MNTYKRILQLHDTISGFAVSGQGIKIKVVRARIYQVAGRQLAVHPKLGCIGKGFVNKLRAQRVALAELRIQRNYHLKQVNKLQKPIDRLCAIIDG
jgi:hypothetical protein